MPHTYRSARLSLAVALTAYVWSTPLVLAQTTCVVTTTADSASSVPTIPGSLRDCMERSRSGDTITFDANIFDLTNSNAATTIPVAQPLPPLDDGNVTIEASDRRVTVNGSGAGSSSGLVISSSGNVIRGLSIVGFSSSGIEVAGADNVIGGDRATGAGPNGQGLRISANGAFGIDIRGSAATGNTVKGCWIGLDSDGTTASANLHAGVAIADGASSNTIGGVVAGEANVISGNALEGITVAGAGTDDNVVIGNVIGESGTADTAGQRSAVGNGSAGVFLSLGTKGTRVGGSAAGEGNVIANNGGTGVEVRASGSRRNSALSNRITRNSGGGIKLFDGSNDGVQPPVIASIQDLGPNSAGTGSTFRVTGTTTAPGVVELFSDSGSQGATFRGRNPSSSGYQISFDAAGDIRNLTGTFTDALDNTSQFAVFGLTAGDTDGDGVSDSLETLAGTGPADPFDVAAVVPALSLDKLKISLNFTKDKDSIQVKASVPLPPTFVPSGATVGIQVAGHAEAFVLDEKGKGESTNGKLALKLAKTGEYVVHLVVKNSSLESSLQSFGLLDTTTVKAGERWLLPIALTTSGVVHHVASPVLYKAKQGKTGKASSPK